MTRGGVIAIARSWLLTRWVHQQCCKGVGVDCLHFIAGVAREAGFKEAEPFFAKPEWHSYGRHPDPEMMFSGCDELMDRIPIADARTADVLVFNCGRHPMHFAFLIEPDHMIHAWLGARKVVEHQLDAEWRSRIIRAYRLRGIE